MNATKTAGIVMVALGTLALVYGGFNYTRSESQVDLGPVSFEVQERERVTLPVWLGVGFIVVGGVLLSGIGRKT